MIVIAHKPRMFTTSLRLVSSKPYFKGNSGRFKRFSLIAPSLTFGVESDAMKYLNDKYILMAPGPVQVSKQVAEAMNQPMIHHRTPEFTEILKTVLELLPKFFLTEQPVMMVPSTGSGGMEAAIVNCFSPGDEVLSIVSGKFGQRWADMAEKYGLNVHRLEVDWGHAIEPELVSQKLAENTKIKGVLTQACETSTATWQPVKAISKLTRTKELLLLVDGITGVGCAHLPMDKWGIDVLVGGSQKAFGLPAGMAFVSLSEKAWSFQKQATCPRYYFDLEKEREANKKFQTHFSSLVPLVRGLKVALEQAVDKGIDHLTRRTGHLAESTRKAATELGYCVFSLSPSPSVTALCPPEGVDAGKLRAGIEEKYNLTLMGGQEHLKGKIVRVGHMGDISNNDQLAMIEALAYGLRDHGTEISDAKIDEVLSHADNFLKMCSNV